MRAVVRFLHWVVFLAGAAAPAAVLAAACDAEAPLDVAVPTAIEANGESAAIVLLNRRVHPVGVQLRLQGFPHAAEGALRPEPATVELPAGGQARVGVKAERLAPGSYPGYVTAIAGDVSVHRSITVSVADPTLAVSTATVQLASADKWETILRWFPLDPPPLVFPVAKPGVESERDLTGAERDALRILLQSGDGRTLTLEPLKLVHAEGDRKRMAVSYDAAGIGRGVYEGKRDKLVVRIISSHMVLFPALALLAGILASLLLHRATGAIAQRDAVHQRILDLWTRVWDVVEGTKAQHAAIDGVSFRDDVRSQLETLEARVTALAAASVGEIEDSAVLKQLDAFAAQVEAWPDVGAAADALQGALVAAAAASKERPSQLPADAEPTPLRVAALLLKRREIRAAEIATLLEQLRAATATVARWTDDQRLAATCDAEVRKLPKEQRAAVGEEPIGNLGWAWLELWTHADASVQFGTHGASAHDALRWLAERLVLVLGRPVAPPASSPNGATHVTTFAMRAASPRKPQEKPEPLAPTAKEARERADGLKTRRRWRAAGVACLAAGIGVLVELKGAYAASATGWGSFFDYVTAFAAGFAAQSTLTLLTGFLSKAIGPVRPAAPATPAPQPKPGVAAPPSQPVSGAGGSPSP